MKRKIADITDGTPSADCAKHAVVDLTIVESDSDRSDSDGLEYIGSAIPTKKHSKKPSTTSKTINDVLRDAKSALNATKITSLPPLQLLRPAQLDTYNLPCSLEFDILPPELAERLFRVMLRESTTWQRNRWFLADRLVESPHTTSFYVRHAGTHGLDEEHDESHWYMGRKELSVGESKRVFVREMLEAAEVIEKRVNGLLEKSEHRRYAIEYGGPWRANVAAANCYQGGAQGVGAHADQLTYLGPYPTIASLSLGTPRNFRLRAVPSLQDAANPTGPVEIPRTYDIRLPHNSLCIMQAGCQEKYKHSVPPQRSLDLFKLKNKATGEMETFIERINITFRFYRPDFAPSTTPLCDCNIPAILRADAKGKAAAMQAGYSLAARATGDSPRKRQPLRPPLPPNLDQDMRFFWQCTAGSQNEGKRCNFFKILDVKAEKRGPCICDSSSTAAHHPLRSL